MSIPNGQLHDKRPKRTISYNAKHPDRRGLKHIQGNWCDVDSFGIARQTHLPWNCMQKEKEINGVLVEKRFFEWEYRQKQFFRLLIHLENTKPAEQQEKTVGTPGQDLGHQSEE